MRTRVRGWRWRPNPLRRRSDVVEAWTVLVIAVLLLVGAPLAGLAAARWAHAEARSAAAGLRAERRQIEAEVVGRASQALPTAHGGRESTYRATVRWAERPGERARTATARVPGGTRTGDTVPVWLDSRDRPVPAPPDGTAVREHAVAVGVCATGGAVAVVLLGHAVVRRAATRRRLAEWERQWALTEPEWTRRGV
ncbi:Rv1733c family protein [Streptomyces broussonetiae]|uniref:Integral membrane protein n=1 Tax=Streptomyces broussonetiae TaxID=2686304 RepID=A0ABV5EBK3_9ACTN